MPASRSNKRPLINTSLQRGDGRGHGTQNRFNGFRGWWETVETVPQAPVPQNTQLKQGVNEMRQVFLALIAILPFLSGCGSDTPAQPPPKAAAPLEVKTVHPSRGEITRSITLPGEIRPLQAATLYAKVSGYLKTIKVDKGDSVKEGDLLAEIEVPELLADRARYKAEVDLADIDYKRLSEAQTKAPDLVVPLSVDTARAKGAMAKASLGRAETLLQFTKIVAPFSGVVTRRMVDPGAFIPAATAGSSPQNAALLTLMDFNTVRLQVAVPEGESPLVAKDQPVKLTVEGLPGRAFEGKITRFAYALDDASKTMLAEIELPNPKLELRPGMYATVKIGIERRENVLLVPAEALVREKANAFVFTVADNKAKKIPVKAGFTDGSKVEILDGLKPEEPVILVGNRTLSDGQPVNVMEGGK
jgi:membrane fusion protein (multidrug efflux system)